MVALIPIVLMIVGALVYALSTNPKLAELGRIVFCAGAFAIAFATAAKTYSLF